MASDDSDALASSISSMPDSGPPPSVKSKAKVKVSRPRSLSASLLENETPPSKPRSTVRKRMKTSQGSAQIVDWEVLPDLELTRSEGQPLSTGIGEDGNTGSQKDVQDGNLSVEEPIGYEPLSSYMCPICFCPPTNATLTPCGHICCGECLFTAVRATMKRGLAHASPETPVPRCPVCRAVLKGWNWRGGGVIGLKPRAVFSL